MAIEKVQTGIYRVWISTLSSEQTRTVKEYFNFPDFRRGSKLTLPILLTVSCSIWIILLLTVNPTFLVREIFLKSSRILYLKNNTRWHEGFKLPLCTFHVVMQIQANFTAIAKSIFYDFYWLFLCLTSLALFLLLWLWLSFTISFRNERKRVYKIAWLSKRFRPA